MTPQEIFEFIRDNLSLDLAEDSGRDYGGPNGMYNFRSFRLKLNLTNPATGKVEVISEHQFSIDSN
jgi:hypothetical protein